MKVYISADIEGVAGVSAPTECDLAHADSAPLRRQMTDEVAAACAGAFAAGADEVVVKDAHWTGRNLDLHRLSAPPGKSLRLIRGWSGHPFSMVQGIDAGFDRLLFVGYHSGAGSGGNPLSHTVSGRLFAGLTLNGEPASEFMLFRLAAASVGVPSAFLSGDEAQCEEARRLQPGIATVATLRGFGSSAVTLAPSEAVALIRAGCEEAVRATRARPAELPEAFEFRLHFHRPADAYPRSFIPGLRQVSDTELLLQTRDYFDVLTVLKIAASMQ